MRTSPVTWESLRSDPSLVRLDELSQRATTLASDTGITSDRFPVLKDSDWMSRVIRRLSSDFTVMVIGHVSSGKSSFINSLLGRKLLVPSDSPTDGVVSVLAAANGDSPEHAEKILLDGTAEPFASIEHATRFLRQQDTPITEQMRCREVRFWLKEPWLKHLRIVNTPGLGDRLKAFEKATLTYLQEDESDLVIWTFFPDTAANQAEIDLFGEALVKRKRSVIGVVTRCLEGREDDPHYDPHEDPAFVGEQGVRRWILSNLSAYLSHVILYDSHHARRLVQRLREVPALSDDPAIKRESARCGHFELQSLLVDILGPGGENVEQARVRSVLRRCGNYAGELANVARAVEADLVQKAEVKKEDIVAWQKVEREIIGPARDRLKDEIRALAHERSQILVMILGNRAADCVREHFGLFDTLLRGIVSWTRICSSASDSLNEQMAEATAIGMKEEQFHEGLNAAAQQIIKEHLTSLMQDLQEAENGDGFDAGTDSVSIGTVRFSASPGDVVGDALAGALKPVISALLKTLANRLEGKAVGTAATRAAGQAAKQAASKAGKAIAKQAAQKGAGATIAKAAGVVTLVLVPFDVAKLVKDFKKGRDNLAEAVLVRYQAERPIYEIRIFDTLWPYVYDAIADILADARARLQDQKTVRGGLLKKAQEAAGLSDSLTDISNELDEKVNG